jgi:hypothetical protein
MKVLTTHRGHQKRRGNMQKAFAEILGSSTDERQALYSTVAAKLETRAENVEKDLYVCWGPLISCSTDARTIRSTSTSRAAPA